MVIMQRLFSPFALSLSKGRTFLEKEGQDFDKLSPNGILNA